MQQALRNVVRELGWRLDHANSSGLWQDRGLQHIDYIFYKADGWQPADLYKVADAGGSDHSPRVAHFALVD